MPPRDTFGLMLLAGPVLGILNDGRGIPPVTLLICFFQAANYLLITSPYFHRNGNLGATCISSEKIIYQRDYESIWLAAITHANSLHLYYNMLSFLLKGRTLERRFGALAYGLLVGLLTVGTHLIYVGLGYGLWRLTDDANWMHQCAVGFSGVCFALKVLTTHYTPSYGRYIMGMYVPNTWSYWVELILIQIMLPNASLLGHFAGILAGLIFLRTPLKTMFEAGTLDIGGFFQNNRPRPRFQSGGTRLGETGESDYSSYPAYRQRTNISAPRSADEERNELNEAIRRSMESR